MNDTSNICIKNADLQIPFYFFSYGSIFFTILISIILAVRTIKDNTRYYASLTTLCVTNLFSVGIVIANIVMFYKEKVEIILMILNMICLFTGITNYIAFSINTKNDMDDLWSILTHIAYIFSFIFLSTVNCMFVHTYSYINNKNFLNWISGGLLIIYTIIFVVNYVSKYNDNKKFSYYVLILVVPVLILLGYHLSFHKDFSYITIVENINNQDDSKQISKKY